jgi:O-antigen/teichoic acid export membrane protein
MEVLRDRALYTNTIINYGARAIFYILSFLAVPLALGYLGKEKFGVFQTVITFLTLASLANLGVNNGLRNKISEYIGENKNLELRSIIGTALLLSLFLSVVLFISGTVFFIYFFKPSFFLKDYTIYSTEINKSIYILFCFFCANIFFGLMSSISFGLHKSYLVTLSQVFHVSLYFILLIFLVNYNSDSSLVYVSFCYGVTMILSQIAIFFKLRKVTEVWPPIFKSCKKYARKLFSVSFGFFILQLSTVILFSADNFILSRLLGPVEVAEYSIAYKLFFMIITIFSITLIQVWNSTTDAAARGDFLWIKNTVKRLNYLLIPVFFIVFTMGLSLNYIVELWIGEDFNFLLEFRILFSVYVLVHCSNAIYVNILNGLGRLKMQTISYLIAAIMNCLFSYFFIVVCNFSVTGILYSKIICIIFTSTVCFYDYTRFVREKIA